VVTNSDTVELDIFRTNEADLGLKRFELLGSGRRRRSTVSDLRLSEART
jgi:hypothetical protein